MEILLAELPLHILAIGGLILALALLFLGFFVAPALRIHWILSRLLKRLRHEELKGPVDLARVFEGKGILQHLWSEFRETLHEERAINPQTGAQEIARLRATQPSAAFFTEETVVDTPVRSEFFKHLPGILTGIGIIGTFAGLILGLQKFNVSEDPTVVRDSLNALLQSVFHAFLVSAGAITLAMITTAVEKALLVGLYRKTERLTQAIDEHFKAGVGEEYLSRLVTASEESASQTRILKDALVEDMRSLLTELIDRQIAASTSSHAQLGQQIATSFGEELRAPLDKIANAVGQVSQDQGSAVQSLLTDVLASFSARMEGMFGSQLSGIHEMQQQTTASLQAAVMQLEKMAGAVEGAGRKASEDMAAQVAEAVRKLESRQAVMNEEMRKFVLGIRDLVSQSQTEAASHLQAVLADLATSAGMLVGDMSSQSHAHVEAMGSQVGALVESIGGATQQIAAAVDRLEGVTTDAIGRMNSGADTLAIAADDFAKAGNGVTGVLAKSEGLTQQLTQAAGSVGLAAKSLDGVMADYRTTRDTLKQMLDAVRGSVDAAKREASLTTDVLQRLESSTVRLAEAQKRADEYLGNVTSVLEEAHAAFADNVERTLSTSNMAFYDSLTQATKLLREAIVELEQTLGSLNPRAVAGARR
jgi:hypothetical protein